MLKKAALYARVSSDKQDVSLSISAQRKAIYEYAQRNGYEIVMEFTDEVKTGRTSARPEYQRMLAMAKRPVKPFDAVLTWKFGRFSRNRYDSIIFKTMLTKYHLSADWIRLE